MVTLEQFLAAHCYFILDPYLANVGVCYIHGSAKE
jgi:hypothetical protein